MKIINPATEEVITDIQEDNKQSVERKFQQIQAAQPSWQQMPLAERAAILQRFAKLLERDIEHLATILTSEVGKPLQQSRNEINGACNRINWLVANAKKYLSAETMFAD